ncbi:SAM dependent carboxyl methyltransferase [Cynara cardunculus var. scolymus]|uniref:SAM dependent carboxyl methyltransferase n=1 Tax=Cynara cardunculus var. scolymus TaxID=59895 RepID=A0A103RS45_CYNCS|nr:SAM dependent carboxyl methyltransferase [Cynara cardunculus var. scolymus]
MKSKEKMGLQVENILHMNTGNGESSYAQNSFLQEMVIRKTLPVFEHTIKGMADLDIDVFGQCFKIADLACSSGRNTLLFARTIMDIVDEVCKEYDRKGPQFEVCLNELYGNDFNTIFGMLPNFIAKLKKEKGENFGPSFVSAVPGSFYGRLFPDQSLHLVHSSYSVHWLSQLPEGLENNKANIYMSKTSPPNVIQGYQKQFYSDFTNFLNLRSEEIVCGGRMVLTFLGRSIADPTNINLFNLPFYTPCEDEVRNFIQNEGSFAIETLYGFQGNWDPYDTDYTNKNDLKEDSREHGKNASNAFRAVAEPLLTSHFGNSIIDVLFNKFERHVAEHLANKKTRYFNILISLTRK